jgi:fido (protein-threonine AMPylation protein)
MASRQDIFIAISSLGPIEDLELKKLLGFPDERQFNQDISILTGDKFIEKQGSKYLYIKNPNSEMLHDLLSFAITYDINYSNYFTSPMLIFLEQTYLQKYFGFKEVQQVDEMKRINISILKKNGFLIVPNQNPFLGKIIQNSFLEYALKLNKRSIAPMDKKKKDLNIETLLVDKLMKKHLSKMSTEAMRPVIPEINYYVVDDPQKGIIMSLSKEQQAIKTRISAINKDQLNTEFMTNYKKAESSMVQNVRNKNKLRKDIILEYHKLLMNDPAIGGIIRQENVYVAGNRYFKTAHFNQIENLLSKFLDRYSRARFANMTEVVKFGAWVHNELQFIHPFVDGNSRLTRLVMDHFFRENNAPIYEIPVAYTSRYTSITKGARNRDDNKLYELLKEVFLYILCQ